MYDEDDDDDDDDATDTKKVGDKYTFCSRLILLLLLMRASAEAAVCVRNNSPSYISPSAAAFNDRKIPKLRSHVT